MAIARKQTLVQLTDELIEHLDREATERGVSRSALIRDAIESHLEDRIEAEKVRQYLEGYRRMPEEEWEMAMARQNAIEAIEEEPW